MGHLNLVAHVDDDGVGGGLDSDPRVSTANLEAVDSLVGEEEGEAAGVGVGRETKCKVGLWALGVEIHPQTRPYVLPSKRILKISFFQSKGLREHLHQSPTQLHQFLPILLSNIPVP